MRNSGFKPSQQQKKPLLPHLATHSMAVLQRLHTLPSNTGTIITITIIMSNRSTVAPTTDNHHNSSQHTGSAARCCCKHDQLTSRDAPAQHYSL
jgi:hypothetical protein